MATAPAPASAVIAGPDDLDGAGALVVGAGAGETDRAPAAGRGARRPAGRVRSSWRAVLARRASIFGSRSLLGHALPAVAQLPNTSAAGPASGAPGGRPGSRPGWV